MQPDTKAHVLYDSMDVKRPDQVILINRNRLAVARGCGRGKVVSDCLVGMWFPLQAIKISWI